MNTATADRKEVVTSPEFRIVQLDKVRESETNPRRHFDDQALKELTASVKEQGVIVPLLVRPLSNGSSGKFEIVAGARRYRAAKAAGLDQVPVLVRELTDEQALEAQVIENLQRADVHPLDEAEGYAALMKASGYDVATIAAKVGKSQSYVYQRMKLVDLIPSAKAAFFGGKITAGHAILVARLQPKDQVDTLEECFSEHAFGRNRREARDEVLSVRALASWLQENIHLDLNAAPWKKDDAELVPKAGSCVDCPKRTGNCPELFPDIQTKDTCTDRTCFQEKQAAFIAKRMEEYAERETPLVKISDDWSKKAKDVLSEAEYKSAEGKKACKETAKGIYVDGPRRGHVISICTSKSCRTHNPYAGSSSGGGGSTRTAEQEKERQAELHGERIRLRARLHVFKAAIDKVTKLDRTHLNEIAEDMVGSSYSNEFNSVFTRQDRKDIEKASESELAKLLVGAYLSGREDKELLAEARRQKVKVQDLQKQAKTECDQERDHKEQVRKWKGRVASQAKSFEEPTCTTCGCTEPKACPGGCSWATLNKKTNAGTCSRCAAAEEK